MTIRGFDPSKVKREHIKHITLVYGGDKPGLVIRLDRFAEILLESGETPSIYKNAKDAIGYLSSGDMFSDSVTIVIYDVSDMLKSDTESKQLYSAFIRALATYDDSSTIVFGASAKGNGMARLCDDIEKMGGVVREVAAPMQNDFMIWLDEYAKSTGREFTIETKNKLASISNGDVDMVDTILSVIGDEIESLGEDEIRLWLDAEEQSNGSDIRQAIENGDIKTLLTIRKTFPSTIAGYRTFLLRLRHNVIDIVIASSTKDGVQSLIDFKASQYGNGNSAYYIMKEKVGKAYLDRYLALYDELNRQITAVSSSSSSEDEMTKLLSVVSACARP